MYTRIVLERWLTVNYIGSPHGNSGCSSFTFLSFTGNYDGEKIIPGQKRNALTTDSQLPSEGVDVGQLNPLSME